jgi:hypothetical protein
MEMIPDDCITEMPDCFLPKLHGYEQEIESLANRILADDLGTQDKAERFNTRMSFIGALSARLIGRGALTAFERVEELRPELTSREQLCAAFEIASMDVLHRLGVMASGYAQEGKVFTVADAMRERGISVDNASSTH